MNKNYKKFQYLPIAAVLVIVISGCSRFSAEIPEGFAFKKEKGSLIAYSHEGVKYSLRGFQNKPEKSLDFWKETLKNQLEGEGSILIDEEIFITENAEGMKYKWLMPLKQDYYIYMTALAVNRKSIIIAEAGAEKTMFEKYEKSINSSLESITLR